MEVTIDCNRFSCHRECDEHAYCDAHYNEAIELAYKEGYEEAKKELKN